MSRKLYPIFVLIIIASVFLAACGGSGSSGSEPASTGSAAMVDGVMVEVRNNHHYAIVTGTYPDSCTRISNVQQEVNGDTFTISLSTDKPADLMCAQMLSPFGVDLLLETGGLMPGEYTVDVNGVSANFTLGQ
jgi:hypothetical protein